MQKEKQKILRVMIIEDEEDILYLYRHFISLMGHKVVCGILHGDNITADFDKNLPDICLIDYKIPGHKSGIDAAIEILTKYASTPIIFITADDQLKTIIMNNDFFEDKDIQVMTKPVKFTEMEKVISNLAWRVKTIKTTSLTQ